MAYLIEAITQSIRDRGDAKGCELTTDMCRHFARAALSAIEASGWAVVPVKRTPEMIQAGEGWASVQSAWEEMLIAAPKVTP